MTGDGLMLTRLKVTGFKNLVDVDVRFGPFTCIAGVNGVGKSNLFDAIGFLSALANNPLIEAAKSVRGSPRSLFHRVGNDPSDRMTFEADLIVPRHTKDDLAQDDTADVTFLRYQLTLGIRNLLGDWTPGWLEIFKEDLSPINPGDSEHQLAFDHSEEWQRSTIVGRSAAKFISTANEGSIEATINLHHDHDHDHDHGDGSGGAAVSLRAFVLPRTVLSSTYAAGNRTVLNARREMQSWRRFQLEPSALREPDELTAPSQLGYDGSHLAATLYSLALAGKNLGNPSAGNEPDVYAQVTSQLMELIDDVRDIRVDVDRQRELLSLVVKEKDGTEHPARGLSDGTLRFLALAVVDLDPTVQGLLCFEEPENGIHPERILAMLKLLGGNRRKSMSVLFYWRK